MANSSNEGGILSGAWNGEWKDDDGNLIDGCVRPSSWSGSAKASKSLIEIIFFKRSFWSRDHLIFDPDK